MRRYANLLQPVYILILFFLPAACQTARTAAPPMTVLPAQANPATVSRMTLHSGDTIDIQFAYAGQFNQTQTVRPDGKLELQLLGEVAAQGKTVQELRAELMKRYAYNLKHPQLAIFVRGLYGWRVFVSGEVTKPGPVDMPGNLTALQAVILAGGFIGDTAEKRNVIVIRNESGHLAGMKLDFKGTLDGTGGAPFYLQPQDIVYVPRTTIANMDLWMQQHLWRILPPVSMGTAAAF